MNLAEWQSQGRRLPFAGAGAPGAHLKGSMSGGFETLGIAVRGEHISPQVVGPSALSRA